MTEPDAGSDAGGLRTKATLDGDEWVLDGEKAFITNSGTPITTLITIAARTGPGETSTILVPAGTEGLVVQPPYRKMGWHASDTHGLTLNECRVPADNLLGRQGRGVAQFLAVLDEGRVAISALAVGVIRGCLEHAVAYAKSAQRLRQGHRHQPGRRLCVLGPAGRARRRVGAHLPGRGAADAGRPFKTEAAVAKLFTSEAAVSATRTATQVFGGYGFMDETPVSRFYRDAKILEIGEGTSEIQRLVIARHLDLPV